MLGIRFSGFYRRMGSSWCGSKFLQEIYLVKSLLAVSLAVLGRTTEAAVSAWVCLANAKIFGSISTWKVL
jgi:hypothetical protein